MERGSGREIGLQGVKGARHRRVPFGSSGAAGTFEVNRNDWTIKQLSDAGMLYAGLGVGHKSTNDIGAYGAIATSILFPIIINPGYTYSKDYTYDRNAAVEYARVWAESNNPYYPFYGENGGDCTNFVSQALVAGGLPTDLTWRTYWLPIFGTKTTREWDNAQASYNYFTDLTNDFVKSVNTIETKSDILPLLMTGAVKPGDLMYFEKESNGTITHTAIITQILNGDIIYCQHSGAVNLDYGLGKQRFGANEEIGYKIHIVSIKDEGSVTHGVWL